MKWQDAVATFGVSEVVARTYEALGPITTEDESVDFVLLWWVEGMAGQLEQLESYVRARNGRTGWANMLDPDDAPAEALDWQGQFVGVRPIAGLDETLKRAANGQHSAWQRGTPAAMRAAIQETLTGTKRVTLVERYAGDAYSIALWVYENEVPDAAATTAVITAVKPAALQFVSGPILNGMTWYDAAHQYATWANLVAANATWQTLVDRVPSY